MRYCHVAFSLNTIDYGEKISGFILNAKNKKGGQVMILPKTEELFDLSQSIAEEMLKKCEYPHIALGRIGEFIKECSIDLGREYREIKEGVFVAEDASIWEGVHLVAPCIIGHRAEIRPGAFIRGNAIIGDGAVIGNSTEIKNSVVLNEAQLPHYNYVGDSIIGYRAHMGAGAIASNLRLDKGEVYLSSGKERMASGLRKVGTFLGDYAEIGCGCVLCPGSVIGRKSIIYPLVRVMGHVPEKSIFDGAEIRERVI